MSQVLPDEGLVVDRGGRQIGLFRIGDRVFAINNLCPHRDGPLAEGEFKGSLITCPWHAWSFDVTTGKCTFNEKICVETFPVRVEGDQILVAIRPAITDPGI